MITMDLTMACLCALLLHILYPQTLIRYLTSLALDSVTNNLSSIPFYPEIYLLKPQMSHVATSSRQNPFTINQMHRYPILS
ncbi:hypothetical protein LENED_003652 [Lentinula edodes]|uniref:Uncharacterized protein n=1 Tax=Lentinula edodes TaxID=5353 RepID=A0A1Q3E452_LENED|nr:hypothetical protein LENED_003652 [Lentinula edodes]